MARGATTRATSPSRIRLQRTIHYHSPVLNSMCIACNLPQAIARQAKKNWGMAIPQKGGLSSRAGNQKRRSSLRTIGEPSHHWHHPPEEEENLHLERRMEEEKEDGLQLYRWYHLPEKEEKLHLLERRMEQEKEEGLKEDLKCRYIPTVYA